MSSMSFLEESQQHTLQNIGELLVELRQLIDAQTKAIMPTRFEHRSLTEEPPDSLDARSPQLSTWHTRPPDVQPTTQQVSAGRWRPPPSLTVADITSLEALEAQPYMRTEAPLFNGDDPLGWIFGIQAYFNYFYTDESVRLAVVEKLIEQPASDWFHYYQQNNVDGSWVDFLVAVRHHFAPELTEDEVSQVVDENHLVSLPSIEFVVAVESVANNVLVDTIPVEPAAAETVVLIPEQSCALDDLLESELGQESSSLSKHEDGQQRPVRQTYPHEVEPHFVARASEMKTMFSNLTDEERQRVVKIYGMGDLGETTPASTIYNHGDLQSYARAWVCTIQQFEPKAVFGKSYIQIDGMEDRIFDPGAFVGFGIIQIPYSVVESGEGYWENFCQRKKYMIGAEHYQLIEEVGTRVSASVHCARCKSLDKVVSIQILTFERTNCGLNNISPTTQTLPLVHHVNVLKSHCSFLGDHHLWIVMSYMAGGFSMLILKVVHPDGFEEVVIGQILREVLKGVDSLHQHDQIHRDVNDGNVLIDSRGGIRMGNFGVSAYLFDTAASERAHSHSTFSKYLPMKVLLLTLQSAPPGLSYKGDEKARSNDYISRTLLDGEWSHATLQFGADKRVHKFDPVAFEMRAGSMSTLAIFMALDHGKWNVAYGEPGIQRDGSRASENSSRPQGRPQFQQAQLREQWVSVIERRHENKATYMMLLFEVMEMDEDGHFVVFHTTNFHFATSFPLGRWPFVVANVDREVAGATTEYQSDECADTNVSCEVVADINNGHEVIVSTGAEITARDIADAMIQFQDSVHSFQCSCEDPSLSIVDHYVLYDDRSPMQVMEQVVEIESFWFKEGMQVQPSSQPHVNEDEEDDMLTEILRFLAILASTLRARWNLTVGELIGTQTLPTALDIVASQSQPESSSLLAHDPSSRAQPQNRIPPNPKISSQDISPMMWCINKDHTSLYRNFYLFSHLDSYKLVVCLA